MYKLIGCKNRPLILNTNIINREYVEFIHASKKRKKLHFLTHCVTLKLVQITPLTSVTD